MHPDLSPANIVVSADGEPCLISFGLATTLAEIRLGLLAVAAAFFALRPQGLPA